MGLLDGVLGSVLGNLGGGAAQPDGSAGAPAGAPNAGGGDLLGSILGGAGGGGLGGMLGGMLGGSQPTEPGQAGAGASGGGANHAMLLMAALSLLQKVGGLSGLQQMFSKAGMGGQVGSWIGQGPNSSVTGADVSNALGPQHVQSFAADAGIPHEQAGDALAGLLPGLVNHMTPSGSVPDNNQDLLSSALGALKGAMG